MANGKLIFERVEQLRKAQGKLQKDICDYAGIAVQTLGNWDRHDSMPAADTAIRVAEYLGVSVHWLITGNDDVELSYEEKNLLNKYNHLDERGKHTAQALIETLIKEQEIYAVSQTNTMEVKEPAPAYGDGTSHEAVDIRQHTQPDFDNNVALITYDIFMVPYYGSAAAGKPIDISIPPGEWLPVPTDLLNGDKYKYFAVKIKGDSMTGDGIQDNDFVVMRRAEAPENNRVMLVRYGNESTVKRIKVLENGQVILCWDDGSGKTIEVDSSEYEIQGEYAFIMKK
jgi:repressor LexA